MCLCGVCVFALAPYASELMDEVSGLELSEDSFPSGMKGSQICGVDGLWWLAMFLGVFEHCVFVPEVGFLEKENVISLSAKNENH